VKIPDFVPVFDYKFRPCLVHNLLFWCRPATEIHGPETQRGREEDNLSILLAYIVIEELFVYVDVVNKSQQLGKVEEFCRLSNFLKANRKRKKLKFQEKNVRRGNLSSCQIPSTGDRMSQSKRQLLPAAKSSEATEGSKIRSGSKGFWIGRNKQVATRSQRCKDHVS
jgi:hypothetical protein